MSSTKSLLAVHVLTLLGAYVLFRSSAVQQLNTFWGSKSAPSPSGNSSGYVCDPDYRVTPRFLSYDPIMVHIENFMTPYEVQYLRKLAEPRYEQSRLQQVASEDNSAPLAELDDEAQRRSQTAWLPADPVTECVRRRAQELEGFAPNASMDPLAAVRYGRDDHLLTHYDHFQLAPQRFDRRTSFFAFLGASADLAGGATRFPFVRRLAWPQGGGEWCARGLLDCGGGGGGGAAPGVAVRPRVGSALFWVNFREDGTGHEATAHSGEPILRGEKIGMNIWTIDQILE